MPKIRLVEGEDVSALQVSMSNSNRTIIIAHDDNLKTIAHKLRILALRLDEAARLEEEHHDAT